MHWGSLPCSLSAEFVMQMWCLLQQDFCHLNPDALPLKSEASKGSKPGAQAPQCGVRTLLPLRARVKFLVLHKYVLVLAAYEAPRSQDPMMSQASQARERIQCLESRSCHACNALAYATAGHNVEVQGANFDAKRQLIVLSVTCEGTTFK